MNERGIATMARLHPESRPPGSSPWHPRPHARRLPSAVVHGCLDDGLMVCLGLLAGDPERFAPAAVAWHARLCAWVPGIGFGESRAALAALEAVAGPDPAAAARALSAICDRHGLDQVATALDAWLERRPPVVAALAERPPEPPAAA